MSKSAMKLKFQMDLVLKCCFSLENFFQKKEYQIYLIPKNKIMNA